MSAAFAAVAGDAMREVCDVAEHDAREPENRPDAKAVSFTCFNTENTITVYGRAQADDALWKARELCRKLHSLWSFTDQRSDIARLNEDVAAVTVDWLTAELVQKMRAFNSREPLFDFTIGQASYLWKRTPRVPGYAAIAAALSHTGAESVHVIGIEVRKDDPLLQVDVGAAAKGFAADMVADILRACGIGCADIDLGGNLRFIGQHPDGRPWLLEVDVPTELGLPHVFFEAADCSVSTSSCFLRSRTIGGESYHHIIDPRDGRPSRSDIATATVVSESSAYADMLSTVAVLAGSAGFPALCERHEDAGIVALTHGGEVLHSENLHVSVYSQ